MIDTPAYQAAAEELRRSGFLKRTFDGRDVPVTVYQLNSNLGPERYLETFVLTTVDRGIGGARVLRLQITHFADSDTPGVSELFYPDTELPPMDFIRNRLKLSEMARAEKVEAERQARLGKQEAELADLLLEYQAYFTDLSEVDRTNAIKKLMGLMP